MQGGTADKMLYSSLADDNILSGAFFIVGHSGYCLAIKQDFIGGMDYVINKTMAMLKIIRHTMKIKE